MIGGRAEDAHGFLASFYQNVTLARGEWQSPFFAVARDQLERFFDVLEERVAAVAAREQQQELVRGLHLVFSPHGSLLAMLLAAEPSPALHVPREALPAALLREIGPRAPQPRVCVTAREYFFVRLLGLLARHRDNALWRRPLLEMLERALAAAVCRAPAFAPKALFLLEGFFVFELEAPGDGRPRAPQYDLALNDSLLEIHCIYVDKYVELLRQGHALQPRGQPSFEFMGQLKLYAEKSAHFLRRLLHAAHGRTFNWNALLRIFRRALDPAGELAAAEFFRAYASACAQLYIEIFPAFLQFCADAYPFADSGEVLAFEKILSVYHNKLVVERSFDATCFFPALSHFKEPVLCVLRYWAAHLDVPGLRPLVARVAAMAELREALPELEAAVEQRQSAPVPRRAARALPCGAEPRTWNTVFDPFREYKFCFYFFLACAVLVDRFRGIRPPRPGAAPEGERMFRNGVLVALRNPLLGKRPPPVTNLRFMAQKSVFWLLVLVALAALYAGCSARPRLRDLLPTAAPFLRPAAG